LKRGKQAASFTNTAFKYTSSTKSLYVSKLGKCKIRISRTFTSSPTTVTITKDCSGRYFVTFVLDETLRAFPKTGKEVGIDMGLKDLAVLSTGERIDNQRLHHTLHKRIAKAQRTLARRIKGSNRWERQRIRLACLETKVADTRNDLYNKVTTDIVRRFDFIAVETLGVKNMMRNHKLARSFGDAAVGMFLEMLRYKSEWYGKEFVKIDRFFPSSKRCSDCGNIKSDLTLEDREWTCPSCGVFHDRDLNAAKNILAEGHSVSARGEGVRRQPVVTGSRSPRRSVNQLSVETNQHSVSSLGIH
jgi:putative transposase